MKRQLCFLVVATALAIGSTQAQTVAKQPDKRWRFGVIAGMNRSFPRFSRLFERSDAKTDWLFGADIRRQIGVHSSVHIQPSLTRFSNLRDDDGWQSPIISVTTLKIPVLYRYYVSSTRKSLFVEAGAAYNQVVGSNYRQRMYVNCIMAPCPQLLSDELTPVAGSAVSLMGGIGVEIAVQKITVPITLRYERYLSSYAFSGSGIYDSTYRTSVSFENVSLTAGVNF